MVTKKKGKSAKKIAQPVKQLVVQARDSKGLTVTKAGDFSEWYTQVVQKAGLADIRYNVKGFLVFQPWSVLTMEHMYAYFRMTLENKGHLPYFFPTVIPESNLTKESSHIAGFTPEVFWVTGAGSDVFQERLALRPTSETAFYQMFSLWIRSYKDLPFKTYQRAQVFRYETKATRPFLRSREFHWIEAHCAHATEHDALKQVHEDMATTKEVIGDIFGLPFLFFERPAWDRFAGAHRTFAADVLNPDGKVVQQPSTHVLKQAFAEAFDVKFKDADGKDKLVWITCYGPAISRLFASVVIVHGDDKGLRLPWQITPYHVVIVPIRDDPALLKKAVFLKARLPGYRVHIDTSANSAGEKFNAWELKGVPLRIDVGPHDIEKGQVTLFRRDTNEKLVIAEADLEKTVAKLAEQYEANLRAQAQKLFEGRIATVKTMKEMKPALEKGMIVRCQFCSTEQAGTRCAVQVEQVTGATIRGTLLEHEKPSGNCIVCEKKAGAVVYVARQY